MAQPEIQLIDILHRQNLKNLLSKTYVPSLSKPAKFFTELAAYGRANSSVSISDYTGTHSYLERLVERYPALGKLPERFLMVNISPIIHTPSERDRHPSRALIEIASILTHPEHVGDLRYNTHSVPYIYHLIAAGKMGYLFDPEDRLPLMNAAEKVINAMNDPFTEKYELDAENDIHAAFSTAVLMLSISKTIGREIAWGYWKPEKQTMFEALIAVGFTHNDIFDYFMYGCPTNVAETFRSYTNGALLRMFVEEVLRIPTLKLPGWSYLTGVVNYFTSKVKPFDAGSATWALMATEKEKFMDLFRMSGRGDIIDYDDEATRHPLRDFAMQLQRPDVTRLATIDIVRWVYKHTVWYNGSSQLTARTGEVVEVHNHTVVHNILNMSYVEPYSERRFANNCTPSEFLEIWSDVVLTVANQTLSEKLDFEVAPFELKEFTVQVDGMDETVTFVQLMNSVDLKLEGSKMGHCIGGYGKRMADGENFAFHLNSSNRSYGYTLHVHWDRLAKKYIIAEIRGRYNSAVSVAVQAEIVEQLNSHVIPEMN